MTLVIGLLVTGVLAWLSYSQYMKNEDRLLKLRVRDAGALLTGALPNIQSELASVAYLADATNGNAQKLKAFLAPYVGRTPGHEFISVSLWKLSSVQRGPVMVIGSAPKLRASAQASALFHTSAETGKLGIIGLLQSHADRLGYAFTTPGSAGGYIAYGESPLPSDRRSAIQSSSEYAGLDYALYIGSEPRPQNLLLTSQARLPLPGPHESVTIPFGTSSLTLVMSARSSLAGTLSQRLPWIIGFVGALLALAAAAGMLRLTQRRRSAEDLAQRLDLSATENRRLYAEQRAIAQTLQHALLPAALPQVEGVQTSARYEAGEPGIDVGGDWYDAIELEDGALLLVVGDVSGRGLGAATTMASLRWAIQAYAAQNDPPETILTKLSELVSVNEGRQLATILCARVDVAARKISITSAGHLPPLLIGRDLAEYVELEVGLPVGIEPGASYRSTTVSVPPGSTFLAFTDGLVEHRGDLAQGLERLREAAIGDDSGLPELLKRLAGDEPPGPGQDDTVILGIRWTN